MPTLALNTPVTSTYTGIEETYTVGSTGQLTLHLWGGGGGGGTYLGSTVTSRRGGAGGYVTAILNVNAGDEVRVEVGQGGQIATGNAGGTAAAAGGLGGWPDGGFGGMSSGNTAIGFGGGGGSTRVYLNNVLLAIGGGGGGCTGFYSGGNGGGLSGTASTDASSGGGGTQSAGGTGYYPGSSFQGANGGASRTVAQTFAGAGGGGGFFGGGSNGGAGATTHGSGGGGSGYADTSRAYASMQVAVNNSGLAYDVAGIRPAGVGDGGVPATSYVAVTPGGNGAVYLSLTELPSTTTLPTGATTVSYSGSRVLYSAPSNGWLDVEMWGGGGGGGWYTSGGNSARWAGAGGYTKFKRFVKQGDIIALDIGQGGRRAQELNQIGGLGGWPNGGFGGRPGSAYANPHLGGGGGSTGIYINQTMTAVAGAGGGATGFYYGGNGGGYFGIQDPATANNGTGGTQTTPGSLRGAFMRGGDGNSTGSNTIQSGPSGAGGGGGYYGGGGNASTGDGTHGSGGGGSSFHDRSVVEGFSAPGTQSTGNPYNPGTKPSGIAQGGSSGLGASGFTGTSDGGDGVALLNFTPATVPNLPVNAKTTVNASGSSNVYVSTAEGTLTVKMWGAGGGGAATAVAASGTFSASERGGYGGFTTVDIPVKVGQIVRIDVGVGGQGGQWASGVSQGSMVGVGGNGGWPDGGNGGFNNRSIAGGGGGSTRVYLDGYLVAIAGAGGGSSIPSTDRRPGAGGGVNGGNGANTLSGYTTSFGTGGTQASAGSNTPFATDGYVNASEGRGGRGYPNGVSQNVHSLTSGAGGGGGFFGGGGGTATSTTSVYGGGGAGGGSGYLKAGYGGVQEAGTTNTAVGGASDTDYVAGIGVGGLPRLSTSSAGNASNGGDGMAVFFFAGAEPVEAEGDIGTVTITSVIDGGAHGDHLIVSPIQVVTLTAPAADGGGSADVIALEGGLEVLAIAPTGNAVLPGLADAVFDSVVTNLPPVANATGGIGASGEIGTITVLSLIESGPVTEATVILDLTALLTPPVTSLVPQEFEGALVSVQAGANIARDIPQVSTTPPQAYMHGDDMEATGDIGEVIVEPILGFATQATVEPGLPGLEVQFVLGDPPDMATGEASARGIIDPIIVTITEINGFPFTEDMLAVGEAFNNIALDPVLGIAYTEGYVVAVGQEFPTLRIDPFEGNAAGNASAVAVPQVGGQDPSLTYALITPVTATVEGNAEIAPSYDFSIVLVSPEALTERVANVAAPIGTAYVRSVLGGAGENPELPGDAFVFMPGPVIITPIELSFDKSVDNIINDLPVVTLFPPQVDGAPVDLELTVDLPGPVLVYDVSGDAYSGDDVGVVAVGEPLPGITVWAVEALEPAVQARGALGTVRVLPIVTFIPKVALAGSAVLSPLATATAVCVRVENRVAVVEDVVRATVTLKG